MAVRAGASAAAVLLEISAPAARVCVTAAVVRFGSGGGVPLAGAAAGLGAAILADTTGACAGFTSGNRAGNCAAAFGRAGSLRAAAGSGAGSDFWAASTFGATCAGAGATCVGAGAACVGAGAACVEAACVWAAWDAA
jgi:hypothetical protein